ncbi:MAG: sulfoxide reductase heme-binding subunit YedZ [Gammaproteobacteria bacterium]|nr:sulfoxide reductase heme-binding subunit YedZ [Gammaproteobacteria bacterium]
MRRYIKPAVFLICLIPLAILVCDAFHQALGANPVEKITHRTGDWSLRFLLITLAVTPLRKLFGWKSLMRYRRMLGLFAFFYVCLHFATYLVFDHFFDIGEMAKDIAKRPYITVGFTAFLLLIPLAVTSTGKMMKRLGRHWQRLHQLVYVSAVCGILHYLWLVKADLLQPLIYAVILLLLFGIRVWYQRKPLDTAFLEYSN